MGQGLTHDLICLDPPASQNVKEGKHDAQTEKGTTACAVSDRQLGLTGGDGIAYVLLVSNRAALTITDAWDEEYTKLGIRPRTFVDHQPFEALFQEGRCWRRCPLRYV